MPPRVTGWRWWDAASHRSWVNRSWSPAPKSRVEVVSPTSADALRSWRRQNQVRLFTQPGSASGGLKGGCVSFAWVGPAQEWNGAAASWSHSATPAERLMATCWFEVSRRNRVADADLPVSTESCGRPHPVSSLRCQWKYIIRKVNIRRPATGPRSPAQPPVDRHPPLSRAGTPRSCVYVMCCLRWG